MLFSPSDTPTHSGPADPIGLALKILEMSNASWIEEKHFQNISNYLHLQPGPQKVDALQRLIALIKRIPDKTIPLDVKQKIIATGQDFLDKAIQEEDSLAQ